MKKTSKEYAEKMLKLDSKVDMIFRNSYLKGYMSAISENNVEELIEALKELIKCIEWVQKRHPTYIKGFLNEMAKAYQALKPHEDD